MTIDEMMYGREEAAARMQRMRDFHRKYHPYR
jgi:hypothetical protein